MSASLWCPIMQRRGAPLTLCEETSQYRGRQEHAHLFLVCLSHFTNACGLNEVRQLEGRLFQASLPLQVFPLLTPMPRHRHCIPVGLRN